MEHFPLPKQNQDFKTKDLETLEWNLQDAKQELSKLLESGGAEFTRVQELEAHIQELQQEIEYRIQNN